MAWQSDAVIMLRSLINDLDTPYTYQNSKLEQILVVAAHFVNKEVELLYTYNVDIEAVTISPDPVDNDDDAFVNLMCLKAACLILGAETKTASSNSMRVQDGAALIDMTGNFAATKALLDRFCADYAKAKTDYTAGNLNAIKAILTPYTQETNPTAIIFG